MHNHSDKSFKLYKNIDYTTDSLKILLYKKAEITNAYKLLENTIESSKLKAVKPVIEKIKAASFNNYINNLNNSNMCIEYEAENAVLMNALYYNKDSVYGKIAKFISKEDNINYETLLSMFAYKSEYNDYDSIAIINNDAEDIKIKSIYFSNEFDDSDIEIIRRIINDDNIKLFKLEN